MSSVSDTLEQFGQQAIDSLRDAMVSAGVDEGSNLVASVDFNVRYFGSFYVFTIEMADYWKWVDQGRGPTRKRGNGKPLWSRLAGAKGWIARRGIPVPLTVTIYRKTKHGRKRFVKRFKDRKQANQSMGFAMANTIHRHGYKAKPFYKKGLTDKMKDKLRADLSASMAKEVMIVFNENR